MHVRTLSASDDLARYDEWVKGHPQGNLWQSLEWKRYQEVLGREVQVYVTECRMQNAECRIADIVAPALVVIDRTTRGLSTWDIPRGPLWNFPFGLPLGPEGLGASNGELMAERQFPKPNFQGISKAQFPNTFLETVLEDAKGDRCFALYLSPLTALQAKKPRSYNLTPSPRHEQPTATRIIDLTQSEEDILAQMHPKGRYNIKVAQKNGVQVEQSDDVEAFYGLLQETAKRDGFRVLPLKAYKAFLESLPGSFLLMAHGKSHKPIAGLLGVIWGQTGIYYYGASDYTSRSLMAPYALQWEAMRLCKSRGCTRYDLLGVVPPRPLTLTLSRGEREPHHPWAGVSVFKEKFGGTVVRYQPEQQIVLRPALWKMLQWKRKYLG